MIVVRLLVIDADVCSRRGLEQRYLGELLVQNSSSRGSWIVFTSKRGLSTIDDVLKANHLIAENLDTCVNYAGFGISLPFTASCSCACYPRSPSRLFHIDRLI